MSGRRPGAVRPRFPARRSGRRGRRGPADERSAPWESGPNRRADARYASACRPRRVSSGAGSGRSTSSGSRGSVTIVAPGNTRFDLFDVRIEKHGQSDRRRQETPAGVRRLRLLVVGGRAAGAVRVRFLDVDFHLFLGRGIALIIDALEAERIFRRREKAGQVPARRALVQPLLRQIGILRARTDQIPAEHVHDVRREFRPSSS